MRSHGRCVCLLLLCIQLSACYSWHTEEVAPAQAIAGSQPEQVRITEPGGTTVVVLGPTVAGDTLRGRSAISGYPVAIPLAEVLQLETRRSNGTSSALVVAGLGLGAAGIGVAAVCWMSGC
jgi:hypothetical protein